MSKDTVIINLSNSFRKGYLYLTRRAFGVWLDDFIADNLDLSFEVFRSRSLDGQLFDGLDFFNSAGEATIMIICEKE